MATVVTDLRQLDALRDKLARAEKELADPQELADNLAALIETQTKRRIADEKTAPDGTPWEGWSTRYALTRKPNNRLLVDSQSLLDSIASEDSTNSAAVRVGTNMVYGNVHQFGWDQRHIPARPYLGLSDDNTTEVIEALTAYLDSVLS